MRFVAALCVLAVLAGVVCSGDISESFVYSQEVADALRRGDKGVVALESTIISHGMPWPQNLETAQQVESVIREGGAVPATIAIIDGVVHIGLEDAELRALAQMPSKSVAKVSRRDIAAVLAAKATGATTVAATSLLAHKAGIRVFVTGGIGGVHRDYLQTMDVSADLNELGRTPICVVCAGVKSILDIGRTLEYLETQGVTVIGFDTDEFPSFFTRRSGFRAPMRLNTSDQVARLVQANGALALGSGMLVAVPVPAAQSGDDAVIDAAITRALREAEEGGVHGKDITPFLLKTINELTHGASLSSNIALVLNNARVGAAIARDLAALSAPAASASTSTSTSTSTSDANDHRSHRVVVVGGALLDVTGKGDRPFCSAPSTQGPVAMQWGGVARNIAEGLARLGGVDPLLVAPRAHDMIGRMLETNLADLGMATTGLFEPVAAAAAAAAADPAATESRCTGGADGVCVQAGAGALRSATSVQVIDPSGEHVSEVADTAIIDAVAPAALAPFDAAVARAEMLVVDGNLGVAALAHLADTAQRHGVPVLYEPVCTAKAARIVDARALHRVAYITPNADELRVLAARVPPEHAAGLDLARLEDQCVAVHRFVQAAARTAQSNLTILVKLGARGAMVSTVADGQPVFVSAPACTPAHVENVCGAGDSFVAATVWNIVANHGTPAESIALGIRAATLSIEAVTPISPLLSAQALLGTPDHA